MGLSIDIEKVIQGLEFTKEMILFDPSTGECKEPENLNDLDKTTYDACVDAITLLKEQKAVKPIPPAVEMIKLASCPFCGGEAMVFVSESVCVMCKKCHCQTFQRADGCIAEAEKNNALESVINAWNQRPYPIAPYEYEGIWCCGNCNDPVNKNDKFCHRCGHGVKWDA